MRGEVLFKGMGSGEVSRGEEGVVLCDETRYTRDRIVKSGSKRVLTAISHVQATVTWRRMTRDNRTKHSKVEMYSQPSALDCWRSEA